MVSIFHLQHCPEDGIHNLNGTPYPVLTMTFFIELCKWVDLLYNVKNNNNNNGNDWAQDANVSWASCKFLYVLFFILLMFITFRLYSTTMSTCPKSPNHRQNKSTTRTTRRRRRRADRATTTGLEYASRSWGRAGLGGGSKNRPKWCVQTRQLGPRYMFFFVFAFFLFWLMFYVIFRFYLHTQDTRWVMTMKTGPNDSRRVVWALGMFFYNYFFIFFYNLSIFLDFFSYRALPSPKPPPCPPLLPPPSTLTTLPTSTLP